MSGGPGPFLRPTDHHCHIGAAGPLEEACGRRGSVAMTAMHRQTVTRKTGGPEIAKLGVDRAGYMAGLPLRRLSDINYPSIEPADVCPCRPRERSPGGVPS